MTREEFAARIAQLRPLAEANPAAYRWRVRLFAWLGYGFMLLLLVGSLGLVAGMVALLFVSARAISLLIKFGWLVLIFAWKILRSLWVTFDPPAGQEVSREQAPALYAAVDRLTKALGAPRFHHILVTDEFNAAVVQQPRLGVLGWPRNYLLVGLPLLHGLSTEQVEAVLGHELGHLRSGHGRFGAWLYRVSQTWDRLLNQLEGESSWVAKFCHWYVPRFNAWSFGLRLPEEYEADAAAARLTSPRAIADALCALPVREAALGQDYWRPLLARVKTDDVAPGAVYSRLVAAPVPRQAEPDEARTLEQALAAETDTFDTHPSLRARLAALGQEARLLPPPTVSAATELLGPALPALTAHFDALWFAQNDTPWRERHAELTEQLQRLADLQQRHAAGAALSADERWQLADLTEDHVSVADSLPLFRALFDDPALDVQARFAVGRILLTHHDDPAGLPLLDDAMAREPNLREPGLLLQQQYYVRRGDHATAQRLGAAQLRHADEVDAALAERNTIAQKDGYFAAPQPPDDAVLATMRQTLAAHPDVVDAWLLQKQLAHFQEKPLYVLLLELTPKARRQAEASDGLPTLITALTQELAGPGEMFVVPLIKANSWLGDKAKSLPASRFYPVGA